MNRLTFLQKQRAPSELPEQTVDIDVTPVMNMFIILIPFLVSMAVFTHLYIIDFSLPPNVGTSLDDSGGKPKLKITVVVAPEYLAITRGEEMLDSIPLVSGEYQYDLLSEKLKQRRVDTEIQDEVVVAVRDVIRFKYLVRVMDRCRESGFGKLGLSSATESVEGDI